LAKEQATLGIGAGQTQAEYLAHKLSILKAQQANFHSQEASMASDAFFFPFADGVE